MGLLREVPVDSCAGLNCELESSSAAVERLGVVFTTLGSFSGGGLAVALTLAHLKACTGKFASHEILMNTAQCMSSSCTGMQPCLYLEGI